MLNPHSGRYMRKKLILLSRAIVYVLFLAGITIPVYAQDIPADSVASRLSLFARNNTQEKLYVHTDRDFYLAGEIIWFKVYNTNPLSNKPLDLSKIAYIELMDVKGKAVLQAKISLEKGSGNGSFYLPVSLNSGNYQLRAYTSLMKNFSADLYFEKTLTLLNTSLKPDKSSSASAVDIQFFPEGGQLVENQEGKLAFRAIDDHGKGLEFSGIILDQNDNTVMRFQPHKFGIGSFVFTPLPGKSYKALMEINGKTIIREIPVLKSGYTLRLQESGDLIRVVIQASSDVPSQNLSLLVHTRQNPGLARRININANREDIIVSKDKLGDGVSHFTLLNSSGIPLAERLYFKPLSKTLNLKISVDQQVFQSRKKVTLNLESMDEKSAFSDADASIAVYAANGEEASEADIQSYLWLKSELRGNIESPSYYFSSSGEEVKAALDNLMLTHGWRRFVWDDVLNGKNAPMHYLPELEGHIISGKIVNTQTDRAAENIIAYLSVPGKKTHLYGARSNMSGDIRFFTRDLFGPSEIVAQTDTRKDSVYRVDIDSPFSLKPTYGSFYNNTFTEQARTGLLNRNISMQVQNVFTAEKLRSFYPLNIDSSAFYLKPDKRYLLDNFVRFNTMEEVLREYVAEVPVLRQKDEYFVGAIVRPFVDMVPQTVEPLIILDGVPVFDKGNKIIQYDPRKVKTLDVLARKYFLGPLNFNSILNFTTYKGNLEGFQLDRRATIIDYEGIQLKREFYSPVYETEQQLADRKPDFRDLLYWSPEVKIDASGKKTISFYTSDQEGAYTVVLQGISSDGRTGVTKSSFRVKGKNLAQ